MDTQNPVPDQAPTHDIVLKPCPFCGGEATWTGRIVVCVECGMGTDSDLEKAEQLDLWNRRAPDDESLWRFWNNKACEQGKQIGDLRTQVFLLEKQIGEADIYGQFKSTKEACDYYYPLVVEHVGNIIKQSSKIEALEKQVADLTAERDKLSAQGSALNMLLFETLNDFTQAHHEIADGRWKPLEVIKHWIDVRFGKALARARAKYVELTSQS